MRRVNTLSAATVAGSTPGSQNIANQVMMKGPDDVYLLPSSRQALYPSTNAAQDSTAPTIRNPQLAQRQACSRFDDKRPPSKIITIPAHARHPATSADGISIGLPISPLAEVSMAHPPPKKSPNVARQHGKTKPLLTAHLLYVVEIINLFGAYSCATTPQVDYSHSKCGRRSHFPARL